ncbi:MAG: Uma2 family endonuclease [Micromonosporaceae bacterium]
MSEAAAIDQGPDDERVALGELILFHGGEWTESDYEALPGGVRAELHDGRLILVPSASVPHMLASRELSNRFVAIVGDRLRVVQEVDVRMADGRRYRTPDVVVLREPARSRPLDPRNVQLSCEIVSPGGGEERSVKMTVYAEAGIEWYLIVEETPEGFLGELYRLDGDAYRLVADAPAGGVLALPTPYAARLSLDDLA